MPDLLSDTYGEEPTAEDDWPVSRPLTPGQQMHVDHLLHVETDHLAREVLITLKREGVPPRSRWNDFMAQYALWSWYAESDAIAWATLAKIAQSDWDELLAHSDSELVEGVAQDLGDDLIEGLVIIDAKTGDTVLTKTGVVREDGSQYLGLQDTEVEALKGLPLIFVHNHPNGTEASDEDLDSAYRAGAELFIVITRDGREQVYVRGRGRMVLVRDEEASYEVGPGTLDEALYLLAESQAQARAFEDDSPELIFLQEEPRFTHRLAKVAEELDLDTDHPVSELIELVLKKREEDILAFNSAAASFYGEDMTHHILTEDFSTLLDGALPYWKTAEVTGVNLGLLGIVQLFEDSVRAGSPIEYGLFEWVYATRILSSLVGREKSYGIAQIQVPTATQMIERYRDHFSDLSQTVDGMKSSDGSWIDKEVARQLQENESFSIRVAGVYLMHINDGLIDDMRDYTVEITDAHTEDPRSISRHQLQMMTAIGYNQGEGYAIAGLKTRFVGGGMARLREVIHSRPYTDTVEFVRDPSSLVELRAILWEALDEFGVEKLGPGIERAVSISEGELNLLTIAAQFDGLDYLLAEFKEAGAVSVVDGVENTLRLNTYDDDVLGMKDQAFDLYAIAYEGDSSGI